MRPQKQEEFPFSPPENNANDEPLFDQKKGFTTPPDSLNMLGRKARGICYQVTIVINGIEMRLQSYIREADTSADMREYVITSKFKFKEFTLVTAERLPIYQFPNQMSIHELEAALPDAISFHQGDRKSNGKIPYNKYGVTTYCDVDAIKSSTTLLRKSDKRLLSPTCINHSTPNIAPIDTPPSTEKTGKNNPLATIEEKDFCAISTFRTITWEDEEYSLSPGAARVIETLYWAYKDKGFKRMHYKDIIAAMFTGDKSEWPANKPRIQNYFRCNDAKRVWDKKLICNDGKGNFWLNIKIHTNTHP